MRSAIVHAGLLVVALIGALATWTQEPRDLEDEAQVVVWDHAPETLASVHFRAGSRRVDLERRGTGSEAHLWGREEYPTPDPLGGAGPAADSAAGPTPMTIEEFPVAEEGATLFQRLAGLRAIRDLGAAEDDRRATYGLDAGEPEVALRFGDGTERTLVFGSRVTGGGGRYALDAGSGQVYVLEADLLNALEGGAGTLRVNDYLPFEPDQVETVTLSSAGGERTMRRRVVDSPPRTVWVPSGSDRPDVAFGLLVDQMDRLWVTRYRPDVRPETLTPILRTEYADDSGQSIGYLEVYRGEGPDGAAAYYMRTPKTIVPGEIYADQGSRIEQNVESLFRTGRPAGAPEA